MIECFRLCQGFLELSAGGSRCTQKRGDPLQELFWLEAERTQICRQRFLAEVVGFVDGIEDLDKAVNGSCETPGEDVDFSMRGGLGGIVKCESGTPEKVLDNGLPQMGGVVGNLCLEALDHVLRVVEGTADRGFCTVHEAMKAIGGLLPIVGANVACIAVVDGAGDEVDVSIEKIDTLTPYCEPCAAIDPGPPPSQIRHSGLLSIVDVSGNGTNMANVQRLVFVVVEANVDIRVGSRRATRV